jgi:hypothetical protein
LDANVSLLTITTISIAITLSTSTLAAVGLRQ